MDFGRALVLVLVGFVPSIVWLVYYLRKDCHPEPKSLIARTMAAGILTAPLAVIAQLGFSQLAKYYWLGYDPFASLAFFLWAALVEEYVKFLAVKVAILDNPEFDEPTDAMVYMISAALGFAAIENILVLYGAIPDGVGATLRIWVLRFAGATLLHTIASAIMGYCLGLAWFYRNHSRKLIAGGLALATFTHFVFNVTLLESTSRWWGFAATTVALLLLVVMISYLFNRLRDRITIHHSNLAEGKNLV